MRDPPRTWDALVEEIVPHMPPDWTRRAREDADPAWMRLILLVDAQYRLAMPGIDEKIAGTMAELAEDHDERDRRGWDALAATAKRERERSLQRLVAGADGVLPPAQLRLFKRSLEPTLRA